MVPGQGGCFQCRRSIGVADLRGNCDEISGDILPVVDADEASCGKVLRRGVEKALAFKTKQIFGLVLDEVVCAEHLFIATEDVMRWRNERKMALQPTVFGTQGVGNDHGLRGDKDLKALREIFED